jgi:hypothetical protein
MVSRPVLTVLVVLALLLPIATVVLGSVARLLGAMEDAAGEAILIRISQACGILWVLVLVVLLICLALKTLAANDRRSE